MLAEEMRSISELNINNSNKLNEIWYKTLENIRKASYKGENKTIFGCYGYYELREQLIKKLENNGFRVVKGYEIGADYHNQMTQYIIW